MAGISSKAVGSITNKKLYAGNEMQSKEFSDASGLEFYDFNARSFDQQIGRFLQIDPLTDGGGQESLNPYQYCYNNPINNVDPDGKLAWFIPIIVKFVVGAAVEYGSQVYDNYQNGKTGLDAWAPQGKAGYGKIILNGATSTVDPSGGLVKKAVISTGANVVESVGGQLLDNNEVTFGKTITDVTINSASSFVKIDASKSVNKLDKDATKLARVANNSPSPRNTTQAVQAKQTANKAAVVNTGSQTATTETTESVTQKKVGTVNFFVGSDRGGAALGATRIDNATIKKPLMPVSQ